MWWRDPAPAMGWQRTTRTPSVNSWSPTRSVKAATVPTGNGAFASSRQPERLQFIRRIRSSRVTTARDSGPTPGVRFVNGSTVTSLFRASERVRDEAGVGRRRRR